jgi:hypothetical protein
MVKNQDYQISDLILALALLVVLIISSGGRFLGF